MRDFTVPTGISRISPISAERGVGRLRWLQEMVEKFDEKLPEPEPVVEAAQPGQA